MNNQGQQVIHCKRCGSNKVQKQAGIKFALFGLGFMFFAIGILIPILGWFLMMPLGLVMMIIAGAGSLIFKSKKFSFKCKECDHVVEVNKGTYEDYKLAIK